MGFSGGLKSVATDGSSSRGLGLVVQILDKLVSKTVAGWSGNQVQVVVVQILVKILPKTGADWSGNQG